MAKNKNTLLSGICLYIGVIGYVCASSSLEEEAADVESMPMSLAISGGASLGAYEAGLNWAIIKYIKKERERALYERQSAPDLVSIAGASAGGINTLLSAISWCMDDKKVENHSNSNVGDSVSNNLFYYYWSKVSLDRFLPENGQYGDDDGVFSRAEFNKITDVIVGVLAEEIYRDGCQIPFALTATRTEPLAVTIEGVEDIKVKNARFIIPLLLKSNNQQKGKVDLHNYIIGELGQKDPFLGNIIYLPHNSSTKNGKNVLDTDVVKRAVEATSAFPVAFGRVNLPYCLKNADSKGKQNSDSCPSGYSKQQDHFVDGGVFDNMPLGTAKALAELADSTPVRKSKPYNYIYLSPGNRRLYADVTPKSRQQPKYRSFGITQQLSFLQGAVLTAQEYELYNVLRSGEWDNVNERSLLVTSRFPPLTGKYLTHFGAFLDPAFRDYDYYAGVYDATHDIARFLCKASELDKQACLSTQVQIAYQRLDISSDPKAKWVFQSIAVKEHPSLASSDSPWHWLHVGADVASDGNNLAEKLCGSSNAQNLSKKEAKKLREQYQQFAHTQHERSGMQSRNLFAVTTSVLKGCQQQVCKEPDFQQFLCEVALSYDVNETDKSEGSAMMAIVTDNAQWYSPYVTRLSLRMLDLEQQAHQNKESSYRSLFGFAAYGAQKFLVEEPRFAWNQSTARAWYFKLLPYEISRDVRNSEWGVSWEPKLRFYGQFAANIKIAPYLLEEVMNENIGYAQIDGFLSYNQKQSPYISSFGIGPNISYTYDDAPGFKRFNYGISMYIGLAGDFFRFTVGKRSFEDHFVGDESFIYFGVTDISGMLYWMWRSY